MRTTRSFAHILSATAAQALCLGVALFATGATAHAQTLTDITLFRTDGNGNTIGEGWNTRGDETSISNVYLLSGVTPVNSGNSAATTSIAINLSAPGVYTFGFFGDNVNFNTTPPLAMNFFFNNNAATPGISVRGLNGGGFLANGGNTNTPTFGGVAGANTLTFNNNGLQIVLTAFTFNTNSGADQVSSFNNAPNGFGDSTGSFTLTVSGVSAAPEASSLALLALGGVAGAGRLRRRR